jgi:hypothetical protein
VRREGLGFRYPPAPVEVRKLPRRATRGEICQEHTSASPAVTPHEAIAGVASCGSVMRGTPGGPDPSRCPGPAAPAQRVAAAAAVAFRSSGRMASIGIASVCWSWLETRTYRATRMGNTKLPRQWPHTRPAFPDVSIAHIGGDKPLVLWQGGRPTLPYPWSGQRLYRAARGVHSRACCGTIARVLPLGADAGLEAQGWSSAAGATRGEIRARSWAPHAPRCPHLDAGGEEVHVAQHAAQATARWRKGEACRRTGGCWRRAA